MIEGWENRLFFEQLASLPPDVRSDIVRQYQAASDAERSPGPAPPQNPPSKHECRMPNVGIVDVSSHRCGDCGARWLYRADRTPAWFRSGQLDKTRPQDHVNHPAHYTAHPSGVECIAITEHMGFCLGNAIKYIWRADLKRDAIEDLEKARWYLDREIAKRKAKP